MKFHILPGRDISAKQDCDYTLYVKDATETFRQQIIFYETPVIIFCLEWKEMLQRAVSATTSTNYIQTCNKKVKKVVLESHASGNVLIEKLDGKSDSFVELLQVISDQTAIALKNSGSGTLHLYILLLNDSARSKH